MEQTRSEILKTVLYGFYITGVVGADGEANGFTTCWVSQVSFEPQQVVVAVRRDQHTHELIAGRRLLPELPRHGAGGLGPPLRPAPGARRRHGRRLGLHQWRDRGPLFEEAFAHLECRVVGKMEAGDHTVYLGEVASANLRRPADILTDLDTPMEYGG